MKISTFKISIKRGKQRIIIPKIIKMCKKLFQIFKAKLIISKMITSNLNSFSLASVMIIIKNTILRFKSKNQKMEDKF